MAKTLNQFLEGTGILKVKSPDEQRFVDKHVAATIADRNGNGDDVFKGSKVKKIDRRKERHGYESGEDAKVYEEVEGLDEISNKTLKSYTNKAVMGIDPESGTRNPNSISMLKKKAKAHATLGNDQEASRLKSKAKKRDQGLTKAYARIGGITPAFGSPVDKAKNKIPSSYLNRYEEVEGLDETASMMKHFHGEDGDHDGSPNRAESDHEKIIKHLADTVGTKHPVYKSVSADLKKATRYHHTADRNYDNADKHMDYKDKAHQHETYAKETYADHLKSSKSKMQSESAGYSAKAGAAGKDLGQPGKNFAKIARGAAEKYGSEAAGKRVAGAVLKKLRKEDHLIDLLDTVSESQAFTMVTVFNSLSEENQDMFLASCETEEGVEMMLDFSIQNRGAE